MRHMGDIYMDTDWMRPLSETGLDGLKAQEISLHRNFFFHRLLFSPGGKTRPIKTAVILLLINCDGMVHAIKKSSTLHPTKVK